MTNIIEYPGIITGFKGEKAVVLIDTSPRVEVELNRITESKVGDSVIIELQYYAENQVKATTMRLV